MNNAFTSYLDGLTTKGQSIAREAVAVYLRGLQEGKVQIKSSTDIYNQCRDLAMLNIEHFDILLLNQAFRVIKRVNISCGGIDQAHVDVRLIMKHCLLNDATVLVCVHNHPSGNLKPSTDDKHITSVIKKAGELLNIKLLDHVIIGDDNYHSFHDYGEL